MPSRKQAGPGEEAGSSAWQKQAWGRQEEWLQSLCGNAHNTRESMLTPCQCLKAKGIERMKRSVTLRKVGRPHSATSASDCIQQVLLVALSLLLVISYLGLSRSPSPHLSWPLSLNSKVFFPERLPWRSGPFSCLLLYIV